MRRGEGGRNRRVREKEERRRRRSGGRGGRTEMFIRLSGVAPSGVIPLTRRSIVGVPHR